MTRTRTPMCTCEYSNRSSLVHADHAVVPAVMQASIVLPELPMNRKI